MFLVSYLPQALQKEGRLASAQKLVQVFEKSIHVLLIHQGNESSLGNAPIIWRIKHEKYAFFEEARPWNRNDACRTPET